RVNAASSTTLAIRGQEEGCLIDPVRVTILGEELVELSSGLAGYPDEGRQNVDLVEDAVGAARLDHVLPVDERRHAHPAFPARALASTPWAASVRRNFLLRPVVRSQNYDRVVELAGLLQSGNQPTEDVVHFDHAVAENRARRGLARVLVVGIVVEVTAARA